MDIFQQKRYLVVGVVVLAILNLGTILMLWLTKPPEEFRHREAPGPEERREHIQQLLKDELGFDDKQIEQYVAMRKEQSEKVSAIQNEIRQIKKQMFDKVLEDVPQPTLSDSLLALSQKKMAELEELTFQYLLDLKKLCRPDQRRHLKLLIDEFFRQNPPQRISGSAPSPPPPDGERRP